MTAQPAWDGLDDEYTVGFADGGCRRVVEYDGRHVFLAVDGTPRGTHASAIEAIRAHPALHTLDAGVVALNLGDLDAKEVVDTLVVAPGTPLGARWEIDGVVVVNCGWDGYGRKGQLWVAEDLGFGELEGEEILHVADAHGAGDRDLVSGIWYSRVGGLEITDQLCEENEFKTIGRRHLKVSDYLWDGGFYGRGLLELRSDFFGDGTLLRELSPDTRYVYVNGEAYVRWTRAWEHLDGTPVALVEDDAAWGELARTRIEVAPRRSDEPWRSWVPAGPATRVEDPDDDGLFVISACNPHRRRLSAATNASRTRAFVEMIWKFNDDTVHEGIYVIRPAVGRSLDTGRAEQGWAAELDIGTAIALGTYAGQAAVFRLGACHIDIVPCGGGPNRRVPCDVVDIDAPADAPDAPGSWR